MRRPDGSLPSVLRGCGGLSCTDRQFSSFSRGQPLLRLFIASICAFSIRLILLDVNDYISSGAATPRSAKPCFRMLAVVCTKAIRLLKASSSTSTFVCAYYLLNACAKLITYFAIADGSHFSSAKRTTFG